MPPPKFGEQLSTLTHPKHWAAVIDRRLKAVLFDVVRGTITIATERDESDVLDRIKPALGQIRSGNHHWNETVQSEQITDVTQVRFVILADDEDFGCHRVVLQATSTG